MARHARIAAQVRDMMLTVLGSDGVVIDTVEVRAGTHRIDVLRGSADLLIYVIPEEGLTRREVNTVVLLRSHIDHYVYLMDLETKTGMQVRESWLELRQQIGALDDEPTEGSSLPWFVTPLFRDEQGQDVDRDHLEHWCRCAFSAASYTRCKRIPNIVASMIGETSQLTHLSTVHHGLVARRLRQLLLDTLTHEAESLNNGVPDYGRAVSGAAEDYVERASLARTGEFKIDFEFDATRRTTYQAHLQGVLEVVGKCADELVKHGIQDADLWSRTVDSLRRDVVEVVIVGKMKAGKSTLVNRLVGKDVQGTNPTPDTCVITSLRYAEPSSRATVHYRDNVTIHVFEKDEDGWLTFSADNTRLIFDLIRDCRPLIKGATVHALARRMRPGAASRWEDRAFTADRTVFRTLRNDYLAYLTPRRYTPDDALGRLLNFQTDNLETPFQRRLILSVTFTFQPQESEEFKIRTGDQLEAFKAAMRVRTRAVRVDRVDIGLKNKLLKGITIIDTPGTGSVHGWHDEVTLSYLKSSGAMKIFLVSAHKGAIDGDDVKLIKLLTDHARSVGMDAEAPAFLCITKLNLLLKGVRDRDEGAQRVLSSIQQSLDRTTGSAWTMKRYRLELTSDDPADEFLAFRRELEDWLKNTRTDKLLKPSAQSILSTQTSIADDRRKNIEAMRSDEDERARRVAELEEEKDRSRRRKKKIQGFVRDYENAILRETSRFTDGLNSDVGSMTKIPPLITYFEDKQYTPNVTQYRDAISRAKSRLDKVAGVGLPEALFRVEKSLIDGIGEYGREQCPAPGWTAWFKTLKTKAARLHEAQKDIKEGLPAHVKSLANVDAITAAANVSVSPLFEEIDSKVQDLDREIEKLSNTEALFRRLSEEQDRLRITEQVTASMHTGFHDVLGYFDCGIKGCRHREAAG